MREEKEIKRKGWHESRRGDYLGAYTGPRREDQEDDSNEEELLRTKSNDVNVRK